MTTLAEARTAYVDNADYAEDGSVTKARAFVTACRQLVVLMPSQSASGSGEQAAFSIADIREERKRAESWLAEHDTTSNGTGVRYFSVQGYRD